MPTLSDYIYYAFLLAAIIMSFKARKANIPGLVILRLVLCIGFVNEMIAQALKMSDISNNISHYFYIPLEYFLLVFFYRVHAKTMYLKNAMIASAGIYILIALPIIIFNYRPLDYPYPSMIYNINCTFNILWISILMFNLATPDFRPITSVPVFWIFSGMLTFYAGIFFFNGAYNYFMNQDATLAKALRDYINTALNNLMYLVFTYAFYVSWKNTRYSYR
jgi:hypothetical protein